MMVFLCVMYTGGITTSLYGNSTYLVTASGKEGVGGWYDSGGRQIIDGNGTVVASEEGEIGYPPIQGSSGVWTQTPFWHNTTGWFNLYDNTGQRATKQVSLGFDAFGSLGVIGIVSVMIVVGAVIGVKILGIGESDVSLSLIIKGTFFLTLWGVMSAYAFPLISLVPVLGILFWFLLTLLYGVGVVNQVGHPQGDA